MEINEDHPKEKILKLFIPSFPIAREVATITCIWQRFKGRGVEKLYSESGESFRCALMGGSWQGKAGGRFARYGASYVIGVGAYFAFSAFSELGSQDKNKRSWHSPTWSSPDCSWPIAAEAVVWPLRLVVAEAVGQSSTVMYGLSIVCLYFQSLSLICIVSLSPIIAP